MEVNPKFVLQQIQNAKEGKQSAYNFLLNTFWNEVYGFQIKRIQNEYEAEDITIETFARAFDKINTFDSKYSFLTWLITISKNIQIDKFRSKKNEHRSLGEIEKEKIKKIPDDSPSPEDQLIREQNLTQLLQYIKLLKPDYQKVIHLRYFKEMSYNEIADYLKEPLGTVKVRLLRARQLLAEIISETE